MPQALDLIASQATGTTTTWSTARYMGAGAVQIRLKDVTVTGIDGVGGHPTITWGYANYRIGLFWRSGANSMLVASHVIRKYWGQPLGWITIGSVAAGSYSFQTGLDGIYTTSGVRIDDFSGAGGWVTAKFDASFA